MALSCYCCCCCCCYLTLLEAEDRPEPWFEIDAERLIKTVEECYMSEIKIDCIRERKCEKCVEKECLKLLELSLLERDKRQALKEKEADGLKVDIKKWDYTANEIIFLRKKKSEELSLLEIKFAKILSCSQF